ncbi:hypothetical protein M0R04_02090 [Candidatus Dojkabacteria bacterium]|jgi:hypothetical protein|nr:hypothetical protein [Candidatus Dojkabacteria bacterium]
MKTVIKIVEYIKGLKDNKLFKNYLAFVLTLVFGFSMFNAYAQSTDTTTETTVPTVQLDPVKGYKETIEVSQILNGDKSANVETTFAGNLQGGLETAVKAFAPNLYANYDDLQASNVSGFAKNGIIGSIGNATDSLYANLPTVNFPSYLAQEWVPNYNQGDGSVYAANDGYSFLVGIGIDGLWEKTRMIAYILFVVVLLAAGFMIMFRQKIGGQVAVSLFNALPNVIVGLILVTFSFAIVGLFLNFAVMLVNVVGTFLDPTAKSLIAVNSPLSLLNILVKGDFWMNGAGSAIVTSVGAGGILGTIVAGIVLLTGATGVTGGAALPVVGVILAGTVLGLLLIIFIICAIITYASVRVYITILVAYLGIILDTIAGPLYLALSSIPGQQDMRNDWFKRLLKNSLVFPLTFFFINLGIFIMKNNINISFPHGLTSGNFAAADTGQGAIGLLFRSIICIVLFFFAADSPKMLDEFIQLKGGKGVAEAVAGMKKGLSKIPLLGGMFA